MDEKNLSIFLGMDTTNRHQTDSEIISICLIVNEEIYYFEFNDFDSTKLDPIQIENLLFINSNDSQILYKSGESDTTYMRNDKDQIFSEISDLIKLNIKESKKINIFTYINPFEYVNWIKNLKEKLSEELFTNIMNYIDINNLYLVPAVNNLLAKDNNIKINVDNGVIYNTKLVKEIVSVINEIQ